MTSALRLARITLRQFRNLAPQALRPHSRFTLVLGENGQGKTNLLEAVHFALTLRPLRPAKLTELVAQGQPHAQVAVELDLDGVTSALTVGLEVAGRRASRALLREHKIAAIEDYLLPGAVVAFTPDDLSLVRGGPERRRRTLDRAIFNRWPAYLQEVRTFQRLLKSRNALLRQAAKASLRDSFDDQLWPSAAQLVARRHALLAELRPRFAEAFTRIGLLTAPVTLRSTGEGDEHTPRPALEVRLRELAAERLALDQERGFTSVGPQADDLVFAIGGRSARLYASQGQVRALVLALKVAEIENLRERLGQAPILLLDDVSSELDPRRNQSFLGYLRALRSQVLLTTTDLAALGPEIGGEKALWHMEQGAVKIE